MYHELRRLLPAPDCMAARAKTHNKRAIVHHPCHSRVLLLSSKESHSCFQRICSTGSPDCTASREKTHGKSTIVHYPCYREVQLLPQAKSYPCFQRICSTESKIAEAPCAPTDIVQVLRSSELRVYWPFIVCRPQDDPIATCAHAPPPRQHASLSMSS